jgi:hypothetical protein
MVCVMDGSGNHVPNASFFDVSVESTCELEGETTRFTYDGTALFDNVTHRSAGTRCTITAHADELESAVSDPYTVSSSWLATSRQRRVEVTPADHDLPGGYSVRVSIELGEYEGLMLPDGQDLRVSFREDGRFRELDRVLGPMAHPTTVLDVWFALQAPIGADGSDDRYTLHYGNPSAGTPPANGRNVFLAWEDFEDGPVALDRWITERGPNTLVDVRDGRLTVSSSGEYPGDESVLSGINYPQAFLDLEFSCTFGITSQAPPVMDNWHAQFGLHLDDGLSVNSDGTSDKRVQSLAMGSWTDRGDSILDGPVVPATRVMQWAFSSGLVGHAENGNLQAQVPVSPQRWRWPAFAFAPDVHSEPFDVWFDDIRVRYVVPSDEFIVVTLGLEIPP